MQQNHLGMGYWKMHIFVILPQALKLVIPGIANTFLALVKGHTINFCSWIIRNSWNAKFGKNKSKMARFCNGGLCICCYNFLDNLLCYE